MKMYYGGAEIPSHRQLLGKLEVPHVALSYMGLRRRTKRTESWLVADNFPADQAVLIDSGCHTLNREGVEVAQSEISSIAETTTLS
jgi:hypothetical protein